ncbi:MAG: glutamine--tRNA ligase/YqeY domain fusion protein [Deltaproteobacteria bacterium]|jgi:glutaminyl-tRNA synthetase|nr:glutamine--tRNA ligase/YqeY domain fusion protein [Deltaproteobacteria bacterium]MBW2533597.1 glutamine--tRNA ligase/YqeY domain fusion protein [Deltaproteobacteria bacterium]
MTTGNDSSSADRSSTARTPSPGEGSAKPRNFIEEIIGADLAAGRKDGRVATRFPPEPNGYLHSGHAKSICLNFGLAEQFDGTCNLRFDDTNPTKEEVEFVDAIQEDVRWLGFDWAERLHYASDYFDQLYRWAQVLIEKGLAYVDTLAADQIREYRGTLTEPGRESPDRNRPVEESLALFQKMRAGELDEGAAVLRAKIDMASGNLNLRDPILYRIRKQSHHRTGDRWCIYPMYDWAHGQSDSLEGITHSICSLEFEDHRPLYDWFLDHLPIETRPKQIEFARLNLSFTIMSKRKLRQLVEDGHVSGWDDPRMPTLRGMRRRGYPPAALRDFCDRIGVAKRDSMVDVALLEHCVREELNQTSPRVMAVLRPLRVVLDNYPDDQVEQLDAPYFPDDSTRGSRQVPFGKVLYIERDDFMEDPPKKFFRLAPGREVRLRYGYFIRCVEAIKDPATGEVVELRCTYDPETRSGSAPDGRKVKVTLHWVAADHAIDGEVRLYDRLFQSENPASSDDFTADINPGSLERLEACKLEPSMANAEPGSRWQFERLGYFCADAEATADRPVYNRTVTLRDAWAKLQKKR